METWLSLKLVNIVRSITQRKKTLTVQNSHWSIERVDSEVNYELKRGFWLSSIIYALKKYNYKLQKFTIINKY